MKTDVLDVLMYIFERFQDQDFVVVEEAGKLSSELTEVGFSDGEIDSALDWIDGLVDLRDSASREEQDTTKATFSNRIFTDKERVVLSIQAQGFLYHLQNLGVLDAATREVVIERIMALDIEGVDLEQVKWVTMMVMFNLPGQESACAWLENIDDAIH
ncbi:MAG: DUF494 domain-containing protein [Gammaproteobacteria bacterium]|nr:DUF494 domain-containing protein [Gammaproteobacteria bacterium]